MDEPGRMRHSRRRASLVILLAVAAWSGLPPAPSAAVGWIAPLPEPLTVTRVFDPPANPYAAGHRGVDLAGSLGQEVRVAAAGRVVYAGPLAGRGVLSVEHADGLRTTYEPVLASISAGIEVTPGQVIGTLQPGHAGCPVAACLHWGLRRGVVYLDPLLLLRQGPVRLLPRYGANGPVAGLDPALAMTAGPLVVGIIGLVPLAGRRQRPLPVRRAGVPGDRPP